MARLAPDTVSPKLDSKLPTRAHRQITFPGNLFRPTPPIIDTISESALILIRDRGTSDGHEDIAHLDFILGLRPSSANATLRPTPAHRRPSRPASSNSQYKYHPSITIISIIHNDILYHLIIFS
jgi:hypothetical protein